jgi:hypothetical protein
MEYPYILAAVGTKVNLQATTRGCIRSQQAAGTGTKYVSLLGE